MGALAARVQELAAVLTEDDRRHPCALTMTYAPTAHYRGVPMVRMEDGSWASLDRFGRVVNSGARWAVQRQIDQDLAAGEGRPVSVDLPDDLRAITLWQPWAQLVAVGAKSIETRGRRCNYRGPVAIHAAARLYTAADKHADRALWYAAHDVLAMERNEGVYLLPYSAIVAVANLVDCVPMVWQDDWPPRPAGSGAALEVHASGLALWRAGDIEGPDDVSAELPYGVYRPGRYALLLEDVRLIEDPVPAKGNQAVPWRVPEDVAAKVRDQLRAAP